MNAPLRLGADSLRDVALDQGVCIRPVVQEVYDTVTRQTRLIPVACGATRDSKCPPCAQRNRRLRMQQCREGWHLEQEPQTPDSDTADDSGDDPDEGPAPTPPRRTHSTRHRQDVPDL